jgi:hypothetical protein
MDLLGCKRFFMPLQPFWLCFWSSSSFPGRLKPVAVCHYLERNTINCRWASWTSSSHWASAGSRLESDIEIKVNGWIVIKKFASGRDFCFRLDVGTFPVSQETEPYGGARNRPSFMLWMKRFYCTFWIWPEDQFGAMSGKAVLNLSTGSINKLFCWEEVENQGKWDLIAEPVELRVTSGASQKVDMSLSPSKIRSFSTQKMDRRPSKIHPRPSIFMHLTLNSSPLPSNVKLPSAESRTWTDQSLQIFQLLNHLI